MIKDYSAYIDFKKVKLGDVCKLKRPWIFTNGVFDILHRGHIEYLKAAKEIGGSLIIGLNSDCSVKTLNKGDNRPINNEVSRAMCLSSVRYIDAVVIFEEDCPMDLIKNLKPEYYTKGGDYNLNEIPEGRLVTKLGGKVIKSIFKEGYSSSNIINKLEE